MTSPSPAVRRPPVRRAPATPAVPINPQLSNRPSATWPRDALLLAATGPLGWWAAPVIGHPSLSAAAMGAAATACPARIVLGVRASRRSALTATLSAALAPPLGLRQPAASAVRPSRRRDGWVGPPRRIDLRYAPTVDDTDPEWLPTILAVTARRLGANYEVG